MASKLTVTGLSASYDGHDVLHDVSFSAEAGRVTALIGPSGCGKSTLLSCIDRMLELVDGAKQEGSVELDGTDLGALKGDEVRSRVGLVSQRPAPFPFSVLGNLSYIPKYRGVRSKKRLREIATEALGRVGLLDELDGDLGRSALALSGGQQQRLCIARALTADPEVLMLDEPCSSLDVASTADVERTISELKRDRVVLLVTHNLAQAERVADDVVCMVAGRVVWTGAARDLFEQDGPGAGVLSELYH
jgi:phosphate transport system ATP-binding protein